MVTKPPRSVAPKNSSDRRDEIVEEIHAHRAALAKRFHYDLERMFRYYQELELKNPARRASVALRGK